MILQAPVPIEATLPARATEVNPQVAAAVWSSPAAAVVGTAFTRIGAVVLLTAAQTPLLTIAW